MTVESCLRTAHQAGEISADERAALERLYQELLAHYGTAGEAQAELVARLMRQAEHQRRQAALSDAARGNIEQFLLNYRNRRGEADPAKALVAVIEHNGQVRMPEGVSSVTGRAKAIQGLAMARIEGLLDEFRRTWVTGETASTGRLENVVREAAGEGTGDAAAATFARAWLDVAESLRQRFNAAGGAIGELQGWFLPQRHDRTALLARGMENWIADITPRLDLARMRHPLSGNAMTAGDLRQSLEYIYRNITTEGWHAREATAQRIGIGAISNQRADHRFLHFKSADDWLAYQRDYGGGSDPFQAMMEHIRGMSEDIAAMEVLGPNPRATLTYMQNFVEQQSKFRRAGQPGAIFPTQTDFMGRSFERDGSWLATADPVGYANDAIKLSNDMWDMFRGAEDAVVKQRTADVFGTVRNLNVATKLGGATLSAVTDLGFQQMARLFAGLPVVPVYTDVIQSFTTGSRREAERAGFIADSISSALQTDARWAGGMHGPAWSRVLADRVIAWSGLSAWTNAGRRSFQLAISGELAGLADRALADMPEPMQRMFARYGLSASDWDAIRGPANIPGGVDFLRATDVAAAMEGAGRAQERIAERYLEMILQETEYAVPNGTLQAKARAYGGLQRGVLADELWRSAGQFKMFGISVALLQGQRIATEMMERGLWRGAGYAAALLITTTLYGALAMQLKEIAKGRDPRPMDDEKFWGGALLQGGGLGIFGDFLASEQNRMGGGLARTIAGPTADVVAGALSLSSGNMAQWLQGEKTNAGREAVRFLGQNTPGGSLWYLRLAYERVVLEELQRMVDPEAATAFRRKITKQKKDFGNEFWWKPGKTSADRGPSFSGLTR